MNELHKYATFSVDLLGNPIKINSMFSMGRARIFYKGINRNRSIIKDEAAEKLASTIPGTPIIGSYNHDTEDFEGHEIDCSAYGFVPLDPKSKWVQFVEEDGTEREYLEVDVVIWDGRFEEAKSILSEKKSLSMELNPKTMKGTFERINDITYYNITSAEFAGITVLGDDVEPCFKDAQFLTAYSSMVSAYAAYMNNIQENTEGGKNIMDEITEIVEPEVTTEEVTETEVVETEAEETEVEAEENTEIEEDSEVQPENEVEEVEETETAEEEVAEQEETDFEAKDKSKCEAEKEKETCSKCRKNPCVCENACNKDKSKCEAEEEKETCPDCGKNPCVCKDACNKKEGKYQALEAKYESLQIKYNEALSSLNKYTKKEKLEIINKFSTKLESEELIEKLTANVDDYTIEEIKSELGSALVEQISAEEDVTEEQETDTTFSLDINLTDDSITNSAWDLVKRHKASK